MHNFIIRLQSIRSNKNGYSIGRKKGTLSGYLAALTLVETLEYVTMLQENFFEG